MFAESAMYPFGCGCGGVVVGEVAVREIRDLGGEGRQVLGNTGLWSDERRVEVDGG